MLWACRAIRDNEGGDGGTGRWSDSGGRGERRERELRRRPLEHRWWSGNAIRQRGVRRGNGGRGNNAERQLEQRRHLANGGAAEMAARRGAAMVRIGERRNRRGRGGMGAARAALRE